MAADSPRGLVSGRLEQGNGNIDRYLNGEMLFGDDFDGAQLAEWYADEAEGYANLGAKEASQYRYEYHAWNRLLGYDRLPNSTFERVLGFGSAYGDELLPIISRIKNITIVDPSGAFVREAVHGVPATYVKPAPSGALPFPDGFFDLITCFAVLHHVPNVTAVVKELARTLKPGGFMLAREPIVSMGDWRQPRRGLTKRERGIPLGILERIVQGSGLRIVRRTLCGFPVTERLLRLVYRDVYNSPVAVRIDAAVSSLFRWNVNYHPRTLLQRFRPTSAYLVLQRPGLVSAP
jgi:SAM-dependent methyltransferase